MSVEHVEECRHTPVTCTIPKLTLVVQSPTTLCQLNMWQNADIPRSDVTPLPQSNLVVQNPTTPGQFAMWKNADIPRSDIPPANQPSGTEPYYTRSV